MSVKSVYIGDAYYILFYSSLLIDYIDYIGKL